MALCLTSCASRVALHARTDYLTPEYLAAEQLDVPDPKRECFYGQQIVVTYFLPPQCLAREPTLVLQVRYGNRCVETFSKPVFIKRGYWIYQLLNPSFVNKGGILSYKVELLASNGDLLACWRHHVWADIIPEESE